MTLVYRVNADGPEPDLLARAAALLRQGGLVAFPTETVYGLGANALDPAAVARIFAAKGRPADNPLIVHIGFLEQVHELAADWPPLAAQLADRFWPGPLTLVLPHSEAVPDIVTAGGPTVAVRMPAHPVALRLLQMVRLPIAAPSANRSGQLSPTRAEHVLRDLEGRIDLLLDGGPTPGGIESTVLDVTTTPPRLLRPGLVSVAELEAVVGPVSQLQTPSAETPRVLASPGLLERHYAPRTPLECIQAGAGQRVLDLAAEGRRVGWLTFVDEAPRELPAAVAVRRLPRDPAGYAAQLYAMLHELDQAGLEVLVATWPADEPAWQAVRDRLRRASR